MMKTATRITTRDGLLAALLEASEIEHGLLLQYLYAAFSLKQRPSENVTPEEFARLRVWKGTIFGIAVDEMGHLGTVCNLLAAIGAGPHFHRPEFPRPTGYYPFEFELVPFSAEALTRFVIAELPLGGSLDDCLGMAKALETADFLAPAIPEYRYVAELYAAIADAFRTLPEDELFIGRPPAQVDNNWSVNVDMRVVRDRTSALQAIDDIVRDGEGTPTSRPSSHYGRFCQMLRDFRAAPFKAARPVVRNPRTRPVREATGMMLELITHPEALAVAEFFNLTYGLMLQMLVQFFSNAGETPQQRTVIREASARLMSVAIRPASEVLTALPARDDGSDACAGPSFELYLPISLAPVVSNRWVLLDERFAHVIAAAKRIGSASGSPASRLASVADTLQIMRRTLRTAARS